MAADRITYQWETLEKLLAEPNVRDLIVGYWGELSPVKHIPLDIDWSRLLRYEAEFIYRVWTARVNGTLAGFVSFYVQPHIYYRNTLFAVDGGHFLSPAFRDKGRIGWHMWRSAGIAMKEAGVKVVMLHDNAKRPLMPFFLALGAEPLSTMWVWNLEDDQ